MILKASKREKTGTPSSKQARRKGLLPATVYGQEFEPVSVLIEETAMRDVLKTLGRYAIVELDFNGDGKQRAMIQYISREAISSNILNVEFRTVRAGDRVRVTVPINITGGDLIIDAQITQALQELSVEAPVDNIPTEVTYDISKMEIGDVLTVAELELSDDITVLDELDDPVVSVAPPQVFEEPEVDGEEDLDAADVPTVDEDEETEEA